MTQPPIEDEDPLWMYYPEEDPLRSDGIFCDDILDEFSSADEKLKEDYHPLPLPDGIADEDILNEFIGIDRKLEEESYIPPLGYRLNENAEIEDTRTEEFYFEPFEAWEQNGDENYKRYVRMNDDYDSQYDHLTPRERYELGVGSISDIDFDDIENDPELLMAWIGSHDDDWDTPMTDEEMKRESAFYREYDERVYLQINGWVWEKGAVNTNLSPNGELLNLTVGTAKKQFGGQDIALDISENVNKEDVLVLLHKLIALVETDYEMLVAKLEEERSKLPEQGGSGDHGDNAYNGSGVSNVDDIPF